MPWSEDHLPNIFQVHRAAKILTQWGFSWTWYVRVSLSKMLLTVSHQEGPFHPFQTKSASHDMEHRPQWWTPSDLLGRFLSTCQPPRTNRKVPHWPGHSTIWLDRKLGWASEVLPDGTLGHRRAGQWQNENCPALKVSRVLQGAEPGSLCPPVPGSLPWASLPSGPPLCSGPIPAPEAAHTAMGQAEASVGR